MIYLAFGNEAQKARTAPAELELEHAMRKRAESANHAARQALSTAEDNIQALTNKLIMRESELRDTHAAFDQCLEELETLRDAYKAAMELHLAHEQSGKHSIAPDDTQTDPYEVTEGTVA